MPGTSCFEEAFLKVMGKEAPMEVMDMEKAMSTAGLLELFEVEARWFDSALCFCILPRCTRHCRTGRQSTLAASFRHV